MAGFDSKTYRSEVLKPYSKGEGFEQLREVLAELQRDPQSSAYERLDLNTLYAVETPTSSDQLVEWNRQIVPALNKAAQAFPSARLLKALFDVLQQQKHELTDPSFWGRTQAARQKLVIPKLEAGLQQLAVEYPLGVAPRDELISRLRTVGITGVTEDSIISVAERQGLRVFDPPQLPELGVPAKLKGIWGAVKMHPEFRTVMDLLLLHRPQEITDVKFLDQLTAAGTTVSSSDVAAAQRRSEQVQDTDAMQDAQKFLGAVKDEFASDGALHDLVRTTVMELVQLQLNRGKPKLEVRDDLVRRGFNSDDASRLVSILSVGTASGSRIGVESVREKLSQGQLEDARRTLAAISPGEGEEQEFANIGAQIERLVSKKKQLLDTHRQGVASRDFPAALAAINEAIGIDLADPDLVALRDSLPPAAPASVSLHVEGSAVTISWPQGTDDSLTFTLIRAENRVPKTLHDGTVIANGIREAKFTDSTTTAGKTFGYSLFASREGRVHSDPRSEQIMVLPAPTNLTSTADPTGAVLSWNIPANTTGVVVTRLGPDGHSREIDLPNSSSFRATDLQTGASYRFSVRAVYLLPDGRKLSDPVAVIVVPRGTASAVRHLVLSTEMVQGQEAVQGSWASIDGFDVELWQFPRHVDLPSIQLSTQKAIDLGGQRVVILPGGGSIGNNTVRFFKPPAELIKLVPMTVIDNGFLPGHHVLSGTAPQAREVIAERFGDDLRLSWDWPQGDYIMELAWIGNGHPRTRRVTRARYRAEGGAKIANGAAASDITIATVMTVDEESWTSTPVPVDFTRSQALKVTYQMRIKRGLTGKVKCEIIATSNATGRKVPATLVLKEGTIMPTNLEDGKPTERLELDFSDDTSFMHEVALGKIKSPFWLTLFVDGDPQTILVAPPTSQMKG